MAPTIKQNGADFSAETHDRFLRAFTRHQGQIRAYVGTFLPGFADTEDVMQETAVVLWKKFSELDADENFLPWARRVAYYEICKFCRENKGVSLPYDAQLMERIAATYQGMTDELDERRQALDECLKKLRTRDRELIDLCYRTSESVKTISAEIGRPVDAVYHSLGRIRRTLLGCIDRNLAGKEHA